MSENKFKINACKACKKNYDITDINSINQCCYDTLNAFEGDSFPDNQNCKDCIHESATALGLDECKFRSDGYPSWHQAPHYFPAFLEEEGDVGIAKNKCIDACKTNRYPGECEQNCKIDSDAVETVENYVLNQKKYGHHQNDFQKLMSNNYIYKFMVILLIILSMFCITHVAKKMS